MAVTVAGAGVVVIAVAVVTCAGLLLYRRCFGRKSKGTSASKAGKRGTSEASDDEKRLKDVLTWACYSLPELIQEWTDTWTRSLTQTAKTSPLNFQIRFEKLRNISVPPRLSNLLTEFFISDKSLMVRANLLWKEFELILIINPRAAAAAADAGRSVCSIDCHVLVFDLQGTVEGVLQSTGNSSRLLVRFLGEPVMKLEVKPHHEANLEIEALERLVRKTLSETELQLPLWNSFNRTSELERFEYQPNKSTSPNVETLPGNMGGEKRKVLVKIIKANGLITSQETDYSSQQPFCVAIMDSPVQRYVTSSVKNSSNPFFDEQFVFDFDETTKKITFEVHDKDKPESDEFLGMAFIRTDDFVQHNRHVLPLTGKGPMTYGALTVEVSFVEPGQLSSILSLIPNVAHILPSGEMLDKQIGNNRQMAAVNPVSDVTGSRVSPMVTVSEADVTSPSQIPEFGIDFRESTSLPRFSTLPPKGETKKRSSFVSTIKKRFQRKNAGDSRSRSADRSHDKSPSIGEGIYLTPPPSRASAAETTANVDYDETAGEPGGGGGQRSRSNSVRANLRRLFRRKRTPEDSPTRLSNRGIQPSPEGSTGHPSPRLRSSSSATRERASSAQLTTSSLYEQFQ